jgi:hypothetical protein
MRDVESLAPRRDTRFTRFIHLRRGIDMRDFIESPIIMYRPMSLSLQGSL